MKLAYNYTCICLSLARHCIVYIVRKSHHSGELGQLMGMDVKACSSYRRFRKNVQLILTVVYNRETV